MQPQILLNFVSVPYSPALPGGAWWRIRWHRPCSLPYIDTIHPLYLVLISHNHQHLNLHNGLLYFLFPLPPQPVIVVCYSSLSPYLLLIYTTRATPAQVRNIRAPKPISCCAMLSIPHLLVFSESFSHFLNLFLRLSILFMSKPFWLSIFKR